jgi:hypothetical protein
MRDDIHMRPANVVLGTNVAERVKAAGTPVPMFGCKCTAVSERICRNDRPRVSDAAEAGQFGEVVRCGKAQHPGSSLPAQRESRFRTQVDDNISKTRDRRWLGGCRHHRLVQLPVPIASISLLGRIIFRGLVPLNYQPRGKMRACVGSWNEREGGRAVLRYSSHPGVHLENCHAMPCHAWHR